MSAWLLWFVTGIYFYVACEQAYLHNTDGSIIYAGYCIANCGLIRGMK